MKTRLFTYHALCCTLFAVLITGCVQPTKNIDYTAYKNSKPRSILVLPPLNHSPEVNASIALLSLATRPLSEDGYYVIPVTLMSETFKQNGLTQPAEAQSAPLAKLVDIFGADAGLYITVDQYGSSYQILKSVITVAAHAKLVDLKTGQTLWEGDAKVSQQPGDSGGGLVGALVSAAIQQIMNQVVDASYRVADIAANQLLMARQPNGLLYGPYHPKYGTD